MGWRRSVVTIGALCLAVRAAAAASCPGDCNGDGAVTVAELLTAVNIALNQTPVSACAAVDADADGSVVVGELITAVAHALTGCPEPETPRATSTRTAQAVTTATGTVTPTRPSPTPSPSTTPDRRFADNGDGTITDRSTLLVWETKDRADGLHDVDARYVAAGHCEDDFTDCQPDAASSAACVAQLGRLPRCLPCLTGSACVTGDQQPTTVWQWLAQVNATALGGHRDWRIPTAGERGELESIFEQCDDGVVSPHVPAVFNGVCSPGCRSCSCAAFDHYWAAMPSDEPGKGLQVYYGECVTFSAYLFETAHVRAVRGGR